HAAPRAGKLLLLFFADNSLAFVSFVVLGRKVIGIIGLAKRAAYHLSEAIDAIPPALHGEKLMQAVQLRRRKYLKM
ncbi:MAG: hypothetical protein E6689_10940, partial [Corynebacterium striatum]|nr:hypothetical protein [Corynebacterium striatum]